MRVGFLLLNLVFKSTSYTIYLCGETKTFIYFTVFSLPANAGIVKASPGLPCLFEILKTCCLKTFSLQGMGLVDIKWSFRLRIGAANFGVDKILVFQVFFLNGIGSKCVD